MVIGYFYLPFRDPNYPLNAGLNYNVTGLQGWIEKKKFGGEFAKAPIAMDMKQAMGSLSTSGTANNPQWFNPDPTLPYSSHIQGTGEPYGGNFLFEDGRVNWRKSRDIDPGFAGVGMPTWVFYYKIALD